MRVGVARSVGIAQHLGTLVRLRQHVSVGELVVRLERIEIGIVIALARIRAVIRDRRLALEHKSAGQEIEVLLQRELRGDGALEAVLVTLHHLRIGIGHGVRSVRTEQHVLHARVLLVGLVKLRELDGVARHDAREDVVGVDERTRIVAEHRVDVHLAAGGARKVDVHLGQDVEAVDVDIVLEVVQAVLLQHAGIVVVADGRIVAHHLAAAAGIERVVLVVGHVLEHLVVPVDIGIGHRIQPQQGVLYLLGRVARRQNGVVVVLRLVVEPHVRYAVHHRGQLRRGRELRLVAERHGERTLLTLLGGDRDNAVGALRSVQRGCRGILHDRERLDVVGLHARQIVRRHFEAVEKDERALRITERRHASDEEGGVVLPGLAALLVGDESRHTTRQSGGEVARRNLQILGVDRLDRSHDRLLLLLRERHYHHIVQSLLIGHHPDLDLGLALDRNSLVGITHERHLEHVVIRHRERREPSVGTRNGSCRRTLNGYRGARQRLAVLVKDAP